MTGLCVTDGTAERPEDIEMTPLIEPTPAAIREVRNGAHLSQQRLANELWVSASLVSKWERGICRPDGAAIKLLSLIKHKGLDAII